MNGSHVYQPTTLAELAAVLESRPGARLIGGGTLAIPAWQDQDPPADIVFLPAVAELHRHGADWCGAAMTLAEIARATHFPTALRAAAASIGGPAIRNIATIGGNLASGGPSCIAVALLALDATVERLELLTPARTVAVPVAAALSQPQAPIIALRWPQDAGPSAFRKIAVRAAGGPNLASIAIRLDQAGRGCAIAAGSTGTAPHRLLEAERQWARLAGNPSLAAHAAAQAAEATVAVADDGDAEYRRTLIRTLVRQMLLEFSM